jgi:uncharacterized membrane protein
VSRLRTASPYLLTALLAGAGVTHFTHPGFYDPIVPHALPGPARAWTYASGVAELTVAGAVAVPATRRRGALAAALLLVAVFPANVQMALDADTAGERAIAYARLPLQVPLVWWAWSVSRAAGRRGWRDRAR